MTTKELMKLLKPYNPNTLQQLYAIVLEGNHGLEAVKAWINGQEKYHDPDFDEDVYFLMPHPGGGIM